MAPWHRQPCAGGMLHHVDVNTEQAYSATASYFTPVHWVCLSFEIPVPCADWPTCLTQSDVSSGRLIQLVSGLVQSLSIHLKMVIKKVVAGQLCRLHHELKWKCENDLRKQAGIIGDKNSWFYKLMSNLCVQIQHHIQEKMIHWWKLLSRLNPSTWWACWVMLGYRNSNYHLSLFGKGSVKAHFIFLT